MEVRFRPISTWPVAATARRKHAKFRAGYSDTLQLLDRELRFLRARSIVIQLALAEDDIRLDGMPRSQAKPSHPGVVLSFDSSHGPLSYPCDTFDQWEDNLRAIALGLEHLRAVDRFGVTKRGEQYQGWKSLPPGPQAKPAFRSKDEAVLYLTRLVGGGTSVDTIINNEAALRMTLKAAMFRTHPDRGGDPEEFKRVVEAAEVLGAK